jgi:hypothetical protein
VIFTACPKCERTDFPSRAARDSHVYRCKKNLKSFSPKSIRAKPAETIPQRQIEQISDGYFPKETFEANGKVYDLDELGLIWSVLDKFKKPSRSEMPSVKSESLSRFSKPEEEAKSLFQRSMVWLCEYCHAPFPSEKTAVEHEKTCFEKPESFSQEPFTEEKPQSDILIKLAQRLFPKKDKQEERALIDSTEYFSKRS